jgi:hypothetical protein
MFGVVARSPEPISARFAARLAHSVFIAINKPQLYSWTRPRTSTTCVRAALACLSFLSALLAGVSPPPPGAPDATPHTRTHDTASEIRRVALRARAERSTCLTDTSDKTESLTEVRPAAPQPTPQRATRGVWDGARARLRSGSLATHSLGPSRRTLVLRPRRFRTQRCSQLHRARSGCHQVAPRMRLASALVQFQSAEKRVRVVRAVWLRRRCTFAALIWADRDTAGSSAGSGWR